MFKFFWYSLFLVTTLFFSCQSTPKFDTIISGGLVYDGSGSAPFKADIGIIDDKIAEVGDLSSEQADTIISAEGLAVAPGFIDLHAHLEPIMELSACESHIRQGVTTALGGPDGGGPWPFASYLDSLREITTGMNVGYLVGHNTIRKNIMGLENRAPTDEELTKMKEQVATAMDAGAFGISTGLKYIPGAYSDVDEVIALSKVAADKGGFYTSHLREEGLGLLEGVAEAITIGKEAHIPIVLTHHKAVGKPMWGASVKTLAMVDSAREAGIDVMMDQYPYTASQTSISILIPAWAMAGGQDQFLDRLNKPALKDSIEAGILFNLINDRGGGDLSRIQFARVSWKPELEGKNLEDWCNMLGIEPSLENGVTQIIEAQKNGGASCIFHVIDKEDVKRIMQHPMAMVASDGRLTAPGMGSPHPRAYGTFPEVLGNYVREQQVISLEEGIRKMTSLPAKRMGLTDRGTIAPSMYADIVIFDPATIASQATFTQPHQYPVGIQYVLINGKIGVDPEGLVPKKWGKVLTAKSKNS